MDGYNAILYHAGINPKMVLNVAPVNNVCPWCKVACGHLALLSPCDHQVCSDCLDSLVDGNLDRCPFCCAKFTDFSWDTPS